MVLNPVYPKSQCRIEAIGRAGGDGVGPEAMGRAGADFNRLKGERGPGMMTPGILEPSVGSQ